ncbi:MAG: IclR family transcriptional regulator [Inquilinus sp.]|uniref:IclR family transcriptional regulator n=1 Tax=Inquilinus sp. TaxID=1932117 RepID=UPI003F2B37D3
MAGATSRERGIDRAVAILEHLQERRGPVRMGELAKAIGAPRSTLYEIVGRLTAARILEPVGDGGAVFFGRAVHYYAQTYVAGVDLLSRARREVLGLATETGETAQFCMLDGSQYVVMLNEPGRRTFRITSEVGIRLPIPWTASGRLLVAHLDAAGIAGFIPDEDFTLPSGERIDPAAFIAETEAARARGYAVTEELVDRFTCCLAAPVVDHDARAVATLCLVTPLDTPEARRQALLDTLIAAARRLSLAPPGAVGV